MFVRRGPYQGAIIKFTISFSPSDQLPTVGLHTPVFHPLVDPHSGQFAFRPRNEEVGGIAEILEYFKDAFESEQLLDGLAEREVRNDKAWKSWNGRRNGTLGWSERVQRCVNESAETAENHDDKVDGGVIRMSGQIDGKEVMDYAELTLQQRGVPIRDY
jgi:hypothetical protein